MAIALGNGSNSAIQLSIESPTLPDYVKLFQILISCSNSKYYTLVLHGCHEMKKFGWKFKTA